MACSVTTQSIVVNQCRVYFTAGKVVVLLGASAAEFEKKIIHCHDKCSVVNNYVLNLLVLDMLKYPPASTGLFLHPQL